MSRTSFSPFKSAIGLGAIAFVGVMAFMFSFGYFNMSTDNRSDASSSWCQEKGGYQETNKLGRLTGRCLCPNAQVITSSSPRKCRSAAGGLENKQRPPMASASAQPSVPPVEIPGPPVVVPVYE